MKRSRRINKTVPLTAAGILSAAAASLGVVAEAAHQISALAAHLQGISQPLPLKPNLGRDPMDNPKYERERAREAQQEESRRQEEQQQQERERRRQEHERREEEDIVKNTALYILHGNYNQREKALSMLQQKVDHLNSLHLDIELGNGRNQAKLDSYEKNAKVIEEQLREIRTKTASKKEDKAMDYALQQQRQVCCP